jgi:ankyrin repeat protein
VISGKDLIGALLDKGAEVNAKDNDRKTALMVASQHVHAEVANVPRRAGAR